MRTKLRYGDGHVTVEIPRAKLAGRFRGPAGRPIADVDEAVRDCLESPLEAPEWRRAIVPGDSIALAIDVGLAPQAERLIGPIVDYLGEKTPADVSLRVVLTPGADADVVESLRDRLTALDLPITVCVHDPDDEHSHSYLATTEDGRRIYLNRRVADADAMLVIGRIEFDPLVGLRGPATNLFPNLSNAEALHRSRQLALDRGVGAETLQRRQGCDEVGWLAGLFYAMGVALDRDNRIEGLWMGRADAVKRAGEAHSRSAWTVEQCTPPPDLVVATLAPCRAPATWASVSSALETASSLTKADGRVALVADLQGPPGPSGQWLMQTDNPWAVLARVRGAAEADVLSTAQCARAISSCRVHLLSGLEPEVVESLAMTPIASGKELGNLIRHSDRCFLLEDADRASLPHVSQALLKARANR